MRKIFISYRRDDTRPHALAIYRELGEKLHPDSLFFDLDKIAAGKDFRQVIQESLSETGVMLVLIGPQWLTLRDTSGQRRLDQPDDWVRIEIEQALLHHQSDPTLCNIIPILIDNTPMPQASALPKSIAALAPLQALRVRFDRDFERDMERVLLEVQPYLATLGANNPAGPQVLRCPKCRQVDNVIKLTFVRGDLLPPRPLSIPPPQEPPKEPQQANEWSVKYRTPGFIAAFFRFLKPLNQVLDGGCSFMLFLGLLAGILFLALQINWSVLFIAGSIIVALIVLDRILVGKSRSKLRAEDRAEFEKSFQEYQNQKVVYDSNVAAYQKELEDLKHVYGRRKPLWDQLFYCQRDGSSFLPGSPKVDQDPIALIDFLLKTLPPPQTP